MITTIPSDDPGTILRNDRGCWTYANLREMPESPEHVEIIDGVLFMSPSPHVVRHQRVVGRLHRWMGNWVEEKELGEVFTAPADVVVSPTRVVQPDVFFIATDRLGIVGAYVDGPPDLVVEVISPASVDYDRRTKFGLYEDIGVKEYWLVDPDEQTVEVYVLREGEFDQLGRFSSGEEARSVLLDGFLLDVDRIFA